MVLLGLKEQVGEQSLDHMGMRFLGMIWILVGVLLGAGEGSLLRESSGLTQSD